MYKRTPFTSAPSAYTQLLTNEEVTASILPDKPVETNPPLTEAFEVTVLSKNSALTVPIPPSALTIAPETSLFEDVTLLPINVASMLSIRPPESDKIVE